MRWFAVALMLAIASFARADERARADREFERGKKLLVEGKTAEACEAFDESQRLDPTLPTLLNQADCRERNGQLATAWRQFREAARQARTLDDAASVKLGAAASGRAAKLEPRLSTLRIAVAPDHRVEGLEVRLESDIVDPRTWNDAQPIDGGRYQVRATAPGRQPWTTTIDVAISEDAERVEIPVLAAVPAQQPRQPTPQPVHVARTWSVRREIALGVGAAAVVDLGVSFALGSSASSFTDEAVRLCPAPDVACRDADGANRNLARARTRAHEANIGFAIASGAAITATVLWLLGKPDDLVVEPAISREAAGISFAGRF